MDTTRANELFWELGPGPLARRARIMRLDYTANGKHQALNPFATSTPYKLGRNASKSIALPSRNHEVRGEAQPTRSTT